MHSHFEVLAAVLVLVRGPNHGEPVLPSGKRDRTTNLGLRALDRFDDLLGRLIDYLVVVGLEANTDFFVQQP